MTIFLTILSGVTVYVLGQMILTFVIDPIHQQRETIGKIIDFLIYHDDRLTDPGLQGWKVVIDQDFIASRRSGLIEAQTAARQLASELIVRTQAIPGYGFLEKIGWALHRNKIRDAQKGLIEISNFVMEDGEGANNYHRARAIEEALDIVPAFQVDIENRGPD